jgi:hypothetical protein
MKIILFTIILSLCGCSRIIKKNEFLPHSKTEKNESFIGLTGLFEVSTFKKGTHFDLILKDFKNKKKIRLNFKLKAFTKKIQEDVFLFSVPPGQYKIENFFMTIPGGNIKGLTYKENKIKTNLDIQKFPLINLKEGEAFHLGLFYINFSESLGIGWVRRFKKGEYLLEFLPAQALSEKWKTFQNILDSKRNLHFIKKKDGTYTSSLGGEHYE